MKNPFAFTLLGQTCLFVALLLGGCSKENDPAPAQPSCRIIKSNSVSGSSNFTTRYTYDRENRLTESVTDVETRKQSNSSYQYNQKGQLSGYITQDYRYDGASNVTVITRTYTVEYNEKGQVSGYQLSTTSTDPAMLPSTSTSTYEYDSQGNRTRSTTQSGSNAPFVDLHEYKDGNCIKTTFRAGEPGAAIVTYEHYLDQESKSRHLAHVGVFGPSASKNMVKKTTQTIAGDPNYVFVSERTYEFNDKGFPVRTSVTSTSSSGSTSTSVSTSEYACR
ncbi:MAG: hypothetical protein ICV83_28955 [Cytophagales bacterium]|nr:hypothetical protein [Cytophagales bacterium]